MGRLFACYNIGRNAVEIKGGVSEQCPKLRSEGQRPKVLVEMHYRAEAVASQSRGGTPRNRCEGLCKQATQISGNCPNRCDRFR